jgi:hypothetical protein
VGQSAVEATNGQHMRSYIPADDYLACVCQHYCCTLTLHKCIHVCVDLLVLLPHVLTHSTCLHHQGALQVSDEELLQGFRRCRELGALPMVHAENGDAVVYGQQAVFEAGITGPEVRNNMSTQITIYLPACLPSYLPGSACVGASSTCGSESPAAP